MAVGNLLAPASANIDLIAVRTLVQRVERTLSNAAAAVVADLFIDLQLSVHNGGGLHRTGFLHLADLAAAADLAVKLRNPLANDTQIVQIGLHAVIGAAAHRDFEFIRPR